MGSSPDLCIYQGDTFWATVTVLNSDGSAPDLTGYTAEAQIRIAPADYAPLAAAFVCEVAPTGTTPNTIYLWLDAATSSTLLYEHYVWDLQLTTPDGLNVQTVLSGRVNVTLEVTRDVPPPLVRRVVAGQDIVCLEDRPLVPRAHKPLDPAVVGWKAAILDAQAVHLEARFR